MIEFEEQMDRAVSAYAEKCFKLYYEDSYDNQHEITESEDDLKYILDR